MIDKQKFVLTGFAGTRLVGSFDNYVEEYVDRFFTAEDISCGHIDFFLDEGPMFQLYAENGLPVGWRFEPLDVEGK